MAKEKTDVEVVRNLLRKLKNDQKQAVLNNDKEGYVEISSEITLIERELAKLN